MDVDEIVKALLNECKDCSERSRCDTGNPLIYCPNRDAADKLNELNDFQSSQRAKLLASLAAARARIAKIDKARVEGPKIVCLCGSTRFYDAFQRANYELTMAGKIVLSVGFYCHSQEQAHGETVGCTSVQKVALDELHKRKIDLCDRVLVLNVGGYIGESTRSEIDYAQAHGKPVDYLEPLTRQEAEAALGGGEGG